VNDKLGGLVMRMQGTLVFLPAALIVEVGPVPQITRVPGAPDDLLGIALHRDELVPVIAIGPAREAMVICSWGGENVALVGAKILAANVFEADGPTTVLFAGERAHVLDLASIYERVRVGRWGGRWGG
jgi:hypothetical protein